MTRRQIVAHLHGELKRSMNVRLFVDTIAGPWIVLVADVVRVDRRALANIGKVEQYRGATMVYGEMGGRNFLIRVTRRERTENASAAKEDRADAHNQTVRSWRHARR